MQNSTRKRTHGRYVQSGYRSGSDWKENDLYIAREIPGSARDKLVDQTYENAWKDSPEPPIRYDAQMPRTKRKQTVLERFRNAVRQDRLGAACCAILLFFFLLTGALWLQRLADMRENVRMITYYRDLESYYNNENAKIEQRIASAMDGASIRNLAQNSLGMLRPERANTQEIYIQLPDEEEYRSAQSGEEVKPELLDLVLGFLGRMHIGE